MEMEDIFILIKITCFIFGLIGLIISLSEFTKYVLTTKMSRRPRNTELMSPAVYKRMATTHLSEFFTVLSIAICLIFVSLLGTS